MTRFQNAINWLSQTHKKYDRFIYPIALVLGFIIDVIKFAHIPLYASGLVVFLYLFAIGVSIYYLHFFDLREVKSNTGKLVISWLPLIIEYGFGGLFSAFLIFYLRSASLSISIIFILILALILIGSDIFRKHFLRLDVQMGMFFIGLFLFLFFVASVLLGQVGTLPFLAGEGVSVFLILLFLALLWPVASEKFHHLKYPLLASIIGIFISINILYFFDLIPPIPLVMKKAGVYHQVVQTASGNYIAFEEEKADAGFLHLFGDYDKDLRIMPGQPVYVFTSIYAPDNVGTTIFHVWQRFDTAKNAWVTTDRIPFSISGGRKEGYRGYTFKSNPEPGKWRVNVVTGGERLLYRIHFQIEDVKEAPQLQKVDL